MSDNTKAIELLEQVILQLKEKEKESEYTFPVYVMWDGSNFIKNLRRIDSLGSKAVLFLEDGTEDSSGKYTESGRFYLSGLEEAKNWPMLETSKAEAIIAEARRKALQSKWKLPPKTTVKCWVWDCVGMTWLLRDYVGYYNGQYHAITKKGLLYSRNMCVLADPNDPNTPPPMDFVPEWE
jgi:hypothetical protein